MTDEQKYKSYQKASINYDMLKGCVNRLFVSDDKDELPKLYESAKYYLSCIYDYGLHKLSKESDGYEKM